MLALAYGLCWVGWSRRAQFLLVMKLHKMQEMPIEQLSCGEELAVEQERTSITRDIHDEPSIQVQAARNLRTRDPELPMTNV